MNLLPSAVTRAVANSSLQMQANAPHLLFGLGLAGAVTSTVLACRATLKLDMVLDEAKNDLEVAKGINQEDYDDAGESRGKDVALIYGRTIGKVTRLYTPAAIVGGVSVAALTKSHNLLAERNLALSAAYAAVDQAFSAYRARVVDKYGEQEDHELRFPREQIDVVDEKGKTKTETTIAELTEHSMYARFFDEYSPSWSKDPEYNKIFLITQQQWCNDMLTARGHLFLNEVYDALKLQRTKAGSIVGWLIADGNDNYVDFGIFDHNEEIRDFVNGREGSILLDFNVDGIIFDKIREHGERLQWQR